MNQKLTRNIDIYIARKNGVTYRELMKTYDLSMARIQQVTSDMERRLPKMPEIAGIVAKKVIKFDGGNNGRS